MSPSLNGLKVLVVEDDYLIQLDVQTMLENAGATVVTAGSVKEGIEVANENYNAAILDIRLPDGEVRPVAEVLAEKSTPIIFHSGNVENTMWVSGFPEAVVLSKPAAQRVLLEMVRKHSSGESGFLPH